MKTPDHPLRFFQPDVQLIRDDLERLKESFNALKYAEYIDIYNGNNAVLKAMYYY